MHEDFLYENKKLLISQIGELIYQTTSKKSDIEKRQKAFDNRIKSFLAEYYAPISLRWDKSAVLLSGGWLIPTNYNKPSEIVYITITTEIDYEKNKSLYSELYNQLNHCAYYYIIVYDFNKENTLKKLDECFSNQEFLIPRLDYFSFSKENSTFIPVSLEIVYTHFKANNIKTTPSSYLVDFDSLKLLDTLSEDYLRDIYVNRYVFDYLLGNHFIFRGIPSDFDLIVKTQTKFHVLEIKQKFPSKSNGFGMDIRRIEDYKLLMHNYPNISFYYLVREVENSKNIHATLGWYYLPFNDFVMYCKEANEMKLGDTGMLPESAQNKDRETMICPKEKFKKVNII